MIDLTKVVELTTKIDGMSFDGTTFGLAYLSMMGIFIGFIVLGIYKTPKYLLGMFIVVIPFIIMYNDHVEQTEFEEIRNNLRDERELEYESRIIKADCDETRLYIVDVLKSKSKEEKYGDDKLEWVQDLYYHRCEIPLRSEVMKLQ